MAHAGSGKIESVARQLLSQERDLQIKELFLEACELKPEERDSFLETVCADDLELRREIESLLMADGRATSALGS